MAEDVVIWVEDPGNAAVAGAYVGLHNSATKAKLQSGTTNAAGKVTFPAVDETQNGGVYELRIAPPAPGSVTNGSVQNVTVVAAGNNNFDIEVSFTGLDTAVKSYLCRCTGYFEDFTGLPVQGALLEFAEHDVPQLALLTSGDIDSIGILPHRHTYTTDTAGKLTVDLIRGADYRVIMQGFWNNPRIVSVPDAASANLVDVLFPYVGSVEWFDEDSDQLTPSSAPTWAIGVGEEDTLTYTVLSRAGVELDAGEVSLSTSDSDVLSVSGSGGSVTLTGVAVGSASVLIARAAVTLVGITATRVPDVIGVITVTVS